MLRIFQITLILFGFAANFVCAGSLFQDEGLTCYSCQGSSDCSNLNRWIVQKCASNDMCVTLFDKSTRSVVKRGCYKTFGSAEKATCHSEVTENCFKCFSSNCNDAMDMEVFIDCHFCDSETNINCITNPRQIKTRKCQHSCMVALRQFEKPGHPGEYEDTYTTYRGCLYDKPERDREECIGGSESCKSCDTPNCNTFLRPRGDRLSCYHCTDKGCTKPVAKLCPLYKDNDVCAIVYREDRSGIKSYDCDSSIGKSHKFILQYVDGRYATCGESNCNNPAEASMPHSLPNSKFNFTFASTLETRQCVDCNSENDPKCKTEPESLPLKTCNGGVVACFTKVKNGNIIRGCMPEPWDCEDPECIPCATSGCNIQLYPGQHVYCHQCNSTADEDCQKDPKQTLSIRCENEKYCVSAFKDNIVYRGCRQDHLCQKNETESTCKLCLSYNCNMEKMPGGSSSVTALGLSVLTVAAFVNNILF